MILLIPLFQSLFILRGFKPQVVIGTGGYVTGPVLLAARLLKIPSVTLEGNRTPGLTSRLVARLVDLVAVGWLDQARFFEELVRPGARAIATGLPVRREVITLTREEGAKALGLDPGLLTLVVMAGSLGSRRINETLVAALRRMAQVDRGLRDVQILHVTGERAENRVALTPSETRGLAPTTRPCPT